MKKLYYLLPVLGLAMASCSSEEPINNPVNDEFDGQANKYLTINLVASNGMDSRALSPDYVDGTDVENKVSSVRFFFFDESGQPTPVWIKNGTDQSYLSYIDWYPATGDVTNPSQEDNNITVEKVLTATLGLNVPGDYENPELVVAVLNPTPEILSLTSDNNDPELVGPSLEDLQANVSDYYTGLHNSNFVISNSVYVDKDGDEVIGTEIVADNFATTVEEAEENPIVIYVERVLARLDFKLGLTLPENYDGPEGCYPVSDKPYNVDDKDTEIYVKFLGWNITSVTNASRLIKSINPKWGENLLGTDKPWNLFQFHRSFWAMNPDDGEYSIEYGSFNGTANPENNPYPATGNQMPTTQNPTVTIYLQENASPFQTAAENLQPTAEPTKFIIAAQLVGKDGQALSLAEYNFKKYTLDGLKNKLANSDLANLYLKTTSTSGADEYTKILPSQITFKTAQQLKDGPVTADGQVVAGTYDYGVTAPTDDADYYVYAVLASSEGTWTLGEGESAVPFANVQAVNKYIMDIVNHVMVWNTGYTYYYENIRHLGASGTPGYWGIVRNHIYDTTIRSIAGLGTPVYDPNQTIYPEKPKYDESLIQAEIKILQWRIVKEQYDLQW